MVSQKVNFGLLSASILLNALKHAASFHDEYIATFKFNLYLLSFHKPYPLSIFFLDYASFSLEVRKTFKII